MKPHGYTCGRCIYCGKPLYQKRGGNNREALRRSSGIACARHHQLLRIDPGVPRANAS